MSKLLKTFSRNNVIGKTSIDLERFSKSMNEKSELYIPWESNIPEFNCMPIIIKPDDYESPNQAFEADMGQDMWPELTGVERRGYDAHIVSHSIVDKIINGGIDQLLESIKHDAEPYDVTFVVLGNSLNLCSFWFCHFKDLGYHLVFDPVDERIQSALDYAFTGEKPRFIMMNPQDDLLNFSAETDDTFAIVFNYQFDGTKNVTINAVVVQATA